jgi:Sulfurtransferase TusA
MARKAPTGKMRLSSGAPRASSPGAPELVGRRFMAALVARDAKRLEECFQPNARLRALVPSGAQELHGARAIVRQFLSWFGEPDGIEGVEETASPIANRVRLTYRVRERYSDADSEIIEQNAFYDAIDGRILTMDLVCSGHLQATGPTSTGVHRFDAGDLGCGSGLPEEFRRRIESIPVGSVLEVLAKDPSAKEDLPSLARLLGHRVLTVNGAPGGGVLLAVQRAR